MHSTLELVLILLATAVFVVVVFRQLRLPALIGYLLVGILIGPHALAWVAGNEETRHLAEFGVVFLMFSVGLEFSLPKLVTMRRVVFELLTRRSSEKSRAAQPSVFKARRASTVARRISQ